MNPRYTLILFLVFIAFVAFAVTQRDTEPTQLGEGAPTATPEDLLELSADDIEEVTVDAEARSYVLSRVAGGWEVDGEAAGEEVDGLVTRLANPSVTRELPADRDPETYGFATPSLTVTLGVAAGDTYVIVVGDEVPGGYDRYVRVAPGEGAGADATVTRIVIVSGGDLDRLLQWVDEPPLAPTVTPEPTETVEADADAGIGVGPIDGTDEDGDAADGDTEDEEGADESAVDDAGSDASEAKGVDAGTEADDDADGEGDTDSEPADGEEASGQDDEGVDSGDDG